MATAWFGPPPYQMNFWSDFRKYPDLADVMEGRACQTEDGEWHVMWETDEINFSLVTSNWYTP